MDAPAITERLTDALAALRAAGAPPTDAQIVWLGKLAERVQHPDIGYVAWVAGAPIESGGAVFWPMTLLAEAWYFRWYPEFRDDELVLALYAYAHIKSGPGNRELLRLTADRQTVREALRQWSDSCALPELQLVEVCERLQAVNAGESTIPNPDKASEDKPEHYDHREHLALLCKAFPGSAPDYWLCGVSKTVTDGMLRAIESAERAPGAAPDPDDPRMRAIHNFRQAVKWVLHNHEAATDGH